MSEDLSEALASALDEVEELTRLLNIVVGWCEYNTEIQSTKIEGFDYLEIAPELAQYIRHE